MKEETKTITKQLEKALNKFEILTRSMEKNQLQRAKVYYEAVHSDLFAKHVFIERFKLTPSEQMFLYALGSGALVAGFGLSHTYSTGTEVFRRGISISEQQKIAESGIQLVVNTEGKTTVKSIQELTAEDIKQAFTEDGTLRSVNEQLEYVKENAKDDSTTCSVKVRRTYKHTGGTTVDVTLTKAMVKAALLKKPYMFTSAELKAIADKIREA